MKTTKVTTGVEMSRAVLRLDTDALAERGAAFYAEDGEPLHGKITIEFPVAPGSGEAGRVLYDHAKAVGLDDYEAECVAEEAMTSINRRVFVRLLR